MNISQHVMNAGVANGEVEIGDMLGGGEDVRGS